MQGRRNLLTTSFNLGIIFPLAQIHVSMLAWPACSPSFFLYMYVAKLELE